MIGGKIWQFLFPFSFESMPPKISNTTFLLKSMIHLILETICPGGNSMSMWKIIMHGFDNWLEISNLRNKVGFNVIM